ncbi:MAG: hypothetical protein ACHP9T_11165 [Caulobacterales bacterium]|jgi:opacity protein-like surface antigen
MSMKAILLAAATAATLLAPAVASAQDWGHNRNDEGRGGQRYESRREHTGGWARERTYGYGYGYGQGYAQAYRQSYPAYSYGNAYRYAYAAPAYRDREDRGQWRHWRHERPD